MSQGYNHHTTAPPPPPRSTRPMSYMAGDDHAGREEQPVPQSPYPQYSPPLPQAPQSPSAQPYNPQNYAQTNNYHPQYQSHSLPARAFSATGPRPYNPAAYSNTIRSGYGTLSSSHAPVSAAYSPVQYSPPPPPAHSAFPSSPQPSTSAHGHAATYQAYRANQTAPGAQQPLPDRLQQSPSLNDHSPVSYGSPSPNLPDRNSPGFMIASPGTTPNTGNGPFPPPRRSLPPTPEYPDISDYNTGTHPHSRPLPQRPMPDFDEPPPSFDEITSSPALPLSSVQQRQAEQLAQDALFDEVEAVLMTGGPATGINSPGTARGARHESSYSNHRNSYESHSLSQPHTPIANGTTYDDYDSEAEAEAGLQAMREAEEDEQSGFRQSRVSTVTTAVQANIAEPSFAGADDAEDYTGIDMAAFSGGFDAHMAYGGAADQLLSATTPATSTVSNFGRTFPSVSSGSMQLTQPPTRNTSLTAPSYGTTQPATVEDSGFGGFVDPAASSRRKMSFDEGDDDQYYEEHFGDEEVYVQADGRYDRPLPPPPEEQYSDGASEYAASNGQQVPYFPRSVSLNQPATSQVSAPATRRAKTDAEERKRLTTMRASMYGNNEPIFETGSNQGDLDLPALPAGKRFQPQKLGARDYNRCLEPWALSSLLNWLRVVTDGVTELRHHTLVEALIALFTYKVPNINITDAESLAAIVITNFETAQLLVQDEEWSRLVPGDITGVMFQLTGEGCYSRTVHADNSGDRCYSHYCQRTVRKLAVIDPWARQPDWMTFYKLTKEAIDESKRNKKEIELQNNLHEIVTSEESYMGELNVLNMVYRGALVNANPSVIPPKRLTKFVEEVFGKLDAVEKANDDFLLPQLRFRQKEEGPWVKGFSDIFRSWVRKAKAAYVEYAANFPKANYLMKHEIQNNMMFTSFCEGARNNKLSNRLEWYNFLKAPITRLQRYSLLLSTVHKNMKEESEEKSNLAIAIEEVKAITLECDSRVAEGERKTDMAEISSKIKLRKEMKGVDLALDQWGRQLYMKGDLQRMGTSRFTWLETYALLFDNYFVLSKIVHGRDVTTADRLEVFDVSKMPIPMDLLILESVDDDPVVKSSVKGISTVSAAPTRTPSGLPTSPSASTNGLSKIASHQTVTNLDAAAGSKAHDEKILYPFKVRHLGKELFTLFASSAQARKTWCEKIIEAKTKHAASLFAQHAEPFSLRVVADHSFAYESSLGNQRSVIIKGTPLNRAIEDVDRIYAHTGRPAPICRARVNCATTFFQPHGRQMIIVGTDYGVYVTDAANPRGWTRVVNALKVTQAAVLEEFNLLVVISDKSLVAYHLDIVCPPSTHTATGGSLSANDSIRRAPQKLSGARDVGFFTTARMKDRALVFYKKRDGLSSVFKVLEPVYQKSTEKRSRFHIHHRGNTDSFRDYDDFYIAADTRSINVFATTIAIASTKGFEVLNLDKKQPWSVPDLKQAHVATIAARLQGMEPLAMFKLDEASAAVQTVAGTSAHARHSSVSAGSGAGEFLCVYEECAVYINKHGDISRSVVLEFVGRAREACLIGGYLVLFDQDFVEVRNALNGNLKQVIAGRDVRCLDNGRGGTAGQARTIKFALQHPEIDRSQLIVEMVLAGFGSNGSGW